jgi:glycogen synthase kinase 3 beta
MKLLGTPTERELRAMRATCTSSDLPKLKPYPWERVFPSGTSARAIDLAHKLLCYDPSQRLTATQATAHPFFEGVQYMMAGAAHTSVLDLGHSQWQRHLQSVFDNYISSRTAESLEVVAALEASLVTALQGVESVGAESVNHDAAAQLMAPEVTAALQKALRAEETAHAELQKHVVGSLRGDADAGDAHVAKLRAQVAEAKREAGRRCAAAADLRREVDSLHGQLAKLQAQLKAAATKAMPRTAEIASQTEADLKVNVSPGFGRRASARTPSQCGPSLLQGAATSTNAVGGESPVMARASSVEADRAARSSCGGMPGHEVLDPTLWAGASAAAAPR